MYPFPSAISKRKAQKQSVSTAAQRLKNSLDEHRETLCFCALTYFLRQPYSGSDDRGKDFVSLRSMKRSNGTIIQETVDCCCRFY